jgi:hypothetical protein
MIGTVFGEMTLALVTRLLRCGRRFLGGISGLFRR